MICWRFHRCSPKIHPQITRNGSKYLGNAVIEAIIHKKRQQQQRKRA